MEKLVSALKKIKNKKYFNFLGKLSFYSLLSQLILLASSPILTRIYDPLFFAELGLFLAIASSLSMLVNGKYELSIINQKEIIEKKIGFFNFSFLIFFYILFLFFDTRIVFDLGKYHYLIPLMIFTYALLASINGYYISISRFDILGRGKIILSIIIVVFSILIFYFFSLNGLILAYIFGHLFTAIYLIFKSNLNYNKIDRSNIFQYIISFKKFPIYTASSSFIDAISLSLPVFFIAEYFNDFYLGIYVLVLRVTTGPLIFLSKSIYDINLYYISKNKNKSKSLIFIFFSQSKLLFSIIIIPFFLIYFFGEEIFLIVFGNEWGLAGKVSSILILSLSVQFIASSMSGIFSQTGHNKLEAIWRVISLIFNLIFFIFILEKMSFLECMYYLNVLNCFLYILMYIFCFYAAKNPNRTY
jgi:teichuronic acid exporter